MKRSFLIARSNLRRAKGQTAAIILLILFASLMLNLWLMLSMDYKRNFDRYHDKLNAGHVTLALNGAGDELRNCISEILEKDTRTLQYDMDDALLADGSFEYNGGEVSTLFVILEKQAVLNRSVEKIELEEDSESAGGIYLPMLYRSDSSYSVGETITLTLGEHTVTYPICGYSNSVMAGSHNCSMTALVLTADLYEDLKESLPESVFVSVRLRDKLDSEDFEAMLIDEISSQYPANRFMSNSYALVSTSRYISQMICSGIVSAMAFFVTLIALVVIASNVINYVQENMANLGALKAIGYQNRQIISAILLQFLGITFPAAAAGIGLSYCLFPSVNTMMISQTGIPYTVRLLPLPLLITLAVSGGAVALTVWLSLHRIKNIEPITALRQGIRTHSFRRNHIPLEKTQVPLQPALALKTTLSGIKQNVTVCITVLVLSLVIVFSGLMTENVILNMQPFINLIVGETADSAVIIHADSEETFLQVMKADDRVTKIYLYHTTQVHHVGGITLAATLSDDFADLNNPEICIEGRFPKYDNEMVIAAKYAKENGLNVGDEITLTAEGTQANYIISGFTQLSNYLGKDCLLTRSGYERMGTLQNTGYYINLKDGVDIDAFNTETSERFGSSIHTAFNILSALEGTGNVYVALITIIVIAILILSILIITFVLYLLVRTMLNSKKRDYGIMKALGFTTGQLILQTALSFMPAVILSTAAGLVISGLIINPLTALFLSGIGIVKCTFTVPVGFIAAAGIGFVLLAFGIACLLALKIRRIAPWTLLAGE